MYLVACTLQNKLPILGTAGWTLHHYPQLLPSSGRASRISWEQVHLETTLVNPSSLRSVGEGGVPGCRCRARPRFPWRLASILPNLLLPICTVPLLYPESLHTNTSGRADALPAFSVSELCVKGFRLGDGKRTSQTPLPCSLILWGLM